MEPDPTGKLPPSGALDLDIANARTHADHHRTDLLRSSRCGCFCCLSKFSADEIWEWIDVVDGSAVTAICPYCGIDAVIGSASGYPLEKWFLRRMHAQWFRSTTRCFFAGTVP